MLRRRSEGWVLVLAAAGVWAATACTDPEGNVPPGDGHGDDARDAADDATTPDDTGAEDARDDGGSDSDAPDATRSECEVTGNLSYIWIANSAEGTVSKLCTLDGVEVARYVSCPIAGGACDPSRTSVNLHGDMVVTNRDPASGPSSVTKIAGERDSCVDRGGDGLRTSTGPDDVLDWGDDDCVLWNTTLPNAGSTMAIGARATAWDGTENEETGEGGNVWIGALTNNGVYKLDGNTGEVLVRGSVTAGFMPYGGAMDGIGNFWIVAGNCTIGLCQIARVNTATPTEISYFPVPCGYGISVDAENRVWTSGKLTVGGSCVNRFDPSQPEGSRSTTFRTSPITDFLRGLAVDRNGNVWVANTGGDVLQVSQSDVTLLHRIPTGCSEVVGVAIDFADNVWAVSQGSNKAIKITPVWDPEPMVETFPVGQGPYTYSDMTGYQLRTVILY